jgi:hypothetical protein
VQFAQLLQHTVHNLFQIERVKVQDGGWIGGGQQVATLLDTVLDAKILQGRLVLLGQGQHGGAETGGNAGFAKGGHFPKARQIGNAHDAGQDRTLDLDAAAILDKLVIDSRIQKHLCDDKICVIYIGGINNTTVERQREPACR